MGSVEASQLLSIYAIYLCAAMVPGPNILVVGGTSLASSRTHGLATAPGVSVGTLLFSTAALVGLAAFVAALPKVANALRLLGAGYLIFLGERALRAAGRSDAPPITPRGTRTLRRAFVKGLLTNLSNPKSLLFYLSLLNFAVVPGVSARTQILAVLGMVLLSVCWYGSVALAFSRRAVRSWYLRRARWIDGAIGAVLVAAGARLALSHRG